MPRRATGYRFVLLVRPGLHLSDGSLRALGIALSGVSKGCAAPVAAATATREGLHDSVLLLAYAPTGALAAFCRAKLGSVRSAGDALRVEPACVAAAWFHAELTHDLPVLLVRRYLVRFRLFSRLHVCHATDGDDPTGTLRPTRAPSTDYQSFTLLDLVTDSVRRMLPQQTFALPMPSRY